MQNTVNGFQFSILIKSWRFMSKVFEVRVMGDCWHRYKVTICKFPGSGRAQALGTIWGVTPGPLLVLPTLMPPVLSSELQEDQETKARL